MREFYLRMKKFTRAGRNASVRLDTDLIEKIEKQMKVKLAARVGVLGKARSYSDGEKKYPTNAEIGFKNEFGSFSERIPQRSFLRVPLSDHIPDAIKQKGKVFGGLFSQGKVIEAYKKLAALGEGVVMKGFFNRGYGKWQENAALTLALKAPETEPLIHTRQLRDSITSKIVERGSGST
jgi:hypothetical protein